MMAAVAISQLSSSPTAAKDLPQFDPERRCEMISRRAGSSYLAMRHACIDREQASYDRLSGGEWEGANERDQAGAIASLRRFPGAESYELLEAALSGLVRYRQDRDRIDELQTTNHFRRD